MCLASRKGLLIFVPKRNHRTRVNTRSVRSPWCAESQRKKWPMLVRHKITRMLTNGSPESLERFQRTKLQLHAVLSYRTPNSARMGLHKPFREQVATN